jgi:hypothetical protein
MSDEMPVCLQGNNFKFKIGKTALKIKPGEMFAAKIDWPGVIFLRRWECYDCKVVAFKLKALRHRRTCRHHPDAPPEAKAQPIRIPVFMSGFDVRNADGTLVSDDVIDEILNHAEKSHD